MEQNKAERLNENVTEKMCSSDGNVVGEMCSPADADTCGDCGVATKEEYVEILEFTHFVELFSFKNTGAKPCYAFSLYFSNIDNRIVDHFSVRL